jgi:hypothetical protein
MQRGCIGKHAVVVHGVVVVFGVGVRAPRLWVAAVVVGVEPIRLFHFTFDVIDGLLVPVGDGHQLGQERTEDQVRIAGHVRSFGE